MQIVTEYVPNSDLFKKVKI